MGRLEHILVSSLSPGFLHLTPPDKDGDIQIIISAPKFNNLSIPQRITEVFTLLYHSCPDILDNRLIVIQAFSEQQMHDVVRNVFNER